MARQLRSATRALSLGKGDDEIIAVSDASLINSKTVPVGTLREPSSRKRKQPVSHEESPIKSAKPVKRKPEEPKKFEKSSKVKKSASIILGQDPYPNHPFPTPDQCQIVHDLLTQAHGPAIRPAAVPAASTVHAGCGEVPSVLDALMRTLLSANTSAANSSRAFRSLLTKYGPDPDHGGGNWDGVRRGTVKDLFKAIERGGLANIKSKAIKDILDEVYEDGRQNGYGLSLDYLHERSDEEAMAKLTSFKGIGIKTATCVLMFCLRRAAFPVDTHVFRISKLLGWVPTPQYQREIMERESKEVPLELSDEEQEGDRKGGEKSKSKQKKEPPVTRDTAFLHLDARVPADLKYGLHQLMIRHGRYCPTCNAGGGRKYGIGQNGKAIVGKTKKVTVKEENPDGTFEETQVEVVVKEEVSDDEGVVNFGFRSDDKIKMEEEASESKVKPYIPIDAAGGTGEKTGGNPDGSCILGDMISWERLI
ncbi:hypothetical protein ABW19_dt0209045 [Dactylella cylindrospora]|nr:hypothetical protein ABW19_dt0209045 [Dactylella cylindrospora]